MRGGLPGSDSRFMAAAMTEFLLALLAFVAAHVLPARMGLRDRGVALWGERAYLAVYALLSVALLAWLISAAPRAPVIPLWSAGPAGYHFALTLMLPACVLLAGGAASPNPLSINFGVSGYDPSRPGLVGVTRHPLLWGFFLWAVAHLIPNGDLVSLILFGGFALFALLGMVIIDRRKRRQLGEQWAPLAGATTSAPFLAWTGGKQALRWRPRDLVIAVGGGAALYALLLWLHPRVIGPDPAAILL
jgi:uncharacterized membrane protein